MVATDQGIGTGDHRRPCHESPSPKKSPSRRLSAVTVRLGAGAAESVTNLPKRVLLESRVIHEVNTGHALRSERQIVQSALACPRRTDGKISKTAIAINLPSSRYN